MTDKHWKIVEYKRGGFVPEAFEALADMAERAAEAGFPLAEGLFWLLPAEAPSEFPEGGPKPPFCLYFSDGRVAAAASEAEALSLWEPGEAVLFRALGKADIRLRLDSLDPDSFNEKLSRLKVYEPRSERPYLYDRAEDRWPLLPDKPLLPPAWRQEIIAAALRIGRLVGRPFQADFALAGDALRLEFIRPGQGVRAEAFSGLWQAEPYSGLRTGSPFKTSLYAGLPKEAFASWFEDNRLLGPKDRRMSMGDVLYGRSYRNLEPLRKTAEKLSYYDDNAFCSFYGLEKVRKPQSGRKVLGLLHNLKLDLSARHALRTISRETGEFYPEAEEAEALFRRLLDEAMPPEKTAVMWYQLTMHEFSDAGSDLLRQELFLLCDWLRLKAKSKLNEEEQLRLLGRIGGSEELRQAARLTELAKMFCGKPWPGDEDLDRLLAEAFPESRPDASYRRKLRRDLETICRLGGEGELLDLSRYLPRAEAPEGADPYVRRLRSSLYLREKLAARQTRLYRLVLCWSKKMASVLKQDGILSEERDWRFLRPEELQAYLTLRMDAASLRECAYQNRKAYFSWRHYRSPEILGAGHVKSPAYSEDGLIRGIAAGPGRTEGRVFAAENFTELKGFLPGDILLCRQTDQAFTSTLIFASGLVCTEGGLFSHAAVAARELGIPCVTGAAEALDKLGSGERIALDGSLGTVSRIGSGS